MKTTFSLSILFENLRSLASAAALRARSIRQWGGPGSEDARALAERWTLSLRNLSSLAAKIEGLSGRIDIHAFKIEQCAIDPTKGAKSIEAEVGRLQDLVAALRETIDAYGILPEPALPSWSHAPAAFQLPLTELGALGSTDERPEMALRGSIRKRPSRGHRPAWSLRHPKARSALNERSRP
jgi:hypothetical protein